MFLNTFRFYGMSIWFPEYVRKLQEEKYDDKAITYSNITRINSTITGAMDNTRYEGCRFLHVKFEHMVLNHCVFSDCVFENCTFERIKSSRSFFYHSKFVKVLFNVSM